MSSNQIPGVPEGWELVEFRKPNQGDFVISWVGQIEQWSLGDSAYVFPIIRKTEKPERYRQFKDAEEYLPHWGKPVRLKDGVGFDSVTSTSEYTVYVNSGPARVQYTMSEAFEQLAFADGTPFGARIDE
jgi:hypothetical protein